MGSYQLFFLNKAKWMLPEHSSIRLTDYSIPIGHQSPRQTSPTGTAPAFHHSESQVRPAADTGMFIPHQPVPHRKGRRLARSSGGAGNVTLLIARGYERLKVRFCSVRYSSAFPGIIPRPFIAQLSRQGLVLPRRGMCFPVSPVVLDTFYLVE